MRDFYKDATVLKDTFNRIQGQSVQCCIEYWLLQSFNLFPLLGQFGSAMMEYFVFIKWLIKINLLITLMSLALIVPFSLGSLPDQSRPRNGNNAMHLCVSTYE